MLGSRSRKLCSLLPPRIFRRHGNLIVSIFRTPYFCADPGMLSSCITACATWSPRSIWTSSQLVSPHSEDCGGRRPQKSTHLLALSPDSAEYSTTSQKLVWFDDCVNLRVGLSEEVYE